MVSHMPPFLRGTSWAEWRIGRRKERIVTGAEGKRTIEISEVKISLPFPFLDLIVSLSLCIK